MRGRVTGGPCESRNAQENEATTSSKDSHLRYHLNLCRELNTQNHNKNLKLFEIPCFVYTTLQPKGRGVGGGIQVLIKLLVNIFLQGVYQDK